MRSFVSLVYDINFDFVAFCVVCVCPVLLKVKGVLFLAGEESESV